MLRRWILLSSVLAACSSEPPIPLGGADAAAKTDAAPADAAPSVDAGQADALVAPDAGDDDGGAVAQDDAEVDGGAVAPDAGDDDGGAVAQDDAEVDGGAVALDAGDDDGGAAPGDGGAAPDAAVPDGAIAADATPLADGGMGACVVDGVYTTNFFGMPVYFGFYTATGRWGAAEQLADLPANPAIAGPFSFANGVLNLQEDPGSSCPPGAVGAYATLFNAACTSFTLVVNNDPCTKRAMALNGAVFVR